LKSIKVETITETTEFRSGGDLWECVVWSNPIAEAMLEELSLADDERTVIQQTLEALIRKRAGESGSALLANPINIGIGTK
jgi:hypothetical protein